MFIFPMFVVSQEVREVVDYIRYEKPDKESNNAHYGVSYAKWSNKKGKLIVSLAADAVLIATDAIFLGDSRVIVNSGRAMGRFSVNVR